MLRSCPYVHILLGLMLGFCQMPFQQIWSTCPKKKKPAVQRRGKCGACPRSAGSVPDTWARALRVASAAGAPRKHEAHTAQLLLPALDSGERARTHGVHALMAPQHLPRHCLHLRRLVSVSSRWGREEQLFCDNCVSRLFNVSTTSGVSTAGSRFPRKGFLSFRFLFKLSCGTTSICCF